MKIWLELWYLYISWKCLKHQKKCAQPLGCPDIQGICTSRLDMNLISSIYWVILTEFIIPKFISICFFQRRTINSCWNTLKKHFSQKNQNTFSSHSTDMIQNLDCKNWVFPSVLFLMRHHHRLQSWQPKSKVF